MYDDIWTAAKGMYKMEPAIADGGEVTCSLKTDPAGMLEFLHFRKEFEHEEEPVQ
jgi:hypothetical protein